MTEQECYRTIGAAFIELSKFKGGASHGTPDYQTEWRHSKVKELCGDINSKSISIKCIADWAKKSESYVRRKLPNRNRHINTFYARDVVKFLCDEWEFDYPPETTEDADKDAVA